MKAIVLESNGILNYKDVPNPKLMEDECLLQVKSVGICNSDIYRAFENGAYHYPLIMGHEFSGKIIEKGKNVKKLSVGQGVAVFPLIPCFECDACKKQKWIHCKRYDYYGSRRDGAFAEYVSVKSWNLIPIEDDCDLDLIALTEPLAVAVHTFKSIRQKKGNKLLILGGGFIGLSLAKLLEREGVFSEIWLFDRNEFKLKIARDFGLKTFLTKDSSPNHDFEKYFDVVIEACGAVDTYGHSLYYSGNDALVVWMGNIQDNLTLSKKMVSSILRKEIKIQGIWNSDYQVGKMCDWTEAVEIINKENWIKQLITHVVGLKDAPSLLQEMYKVKKNNMPHSYLKAILTIN